MKERIEFLEFLSNHREIAKDFILELVDEAVELNGHDWNELKDYVEKYFEL